MLPEEHPPSDSSLEALEARLRSLPKPAVPADLEDRLLASIPAGMGAGRLRWQIWAGALGAAAAACLLVWAGWKVLGHSSQMASTSPLSASRPAAPTLPPTEHAAGIAAWRQYRRVIDGEELPAFNWPLEDSLPRSVSMRISSDSLN